MLSKSKGQILRVDACFHHLLSLGVLEMETSVRKEDIFESQIRDDAIAAAINFVQKCCKQAAYIAGRGDIKEEIRIIQASELMSTQANMCNHKVIYTLLYPKGEFRYMGGNSQFMCSQWLVNTFYP